MIRALDLRGMYNYNVGSDYGTGYYEKEIYIKLHITIHTGDEGQWTKSVSLGWSPADGNLLHIQVYGNKGTINIANPDIKQEITKFMKENRHVLNLKENHDRT